VFAEIVGHERIRDILGQAVRARRLPPALLLSGPDGVGKRTLALSVARGLLCEAGPGEPCGACSHCRRLDRSIQSLPTLREGATEATDDPVRLNLRLHPDVVLVEPGARPPAPDQGGAGPRTCRRGDGTSLRGSAGVFVVDEAHAMNEQAANALLKSL
jgi:DNA polymerase-3 subunit delta'